ncbi:Stp1/IreP family PP2C-type Ser/Thr phosphatase [Candidatus Poribacteria bacterium]|nr:Stp1/IreP family PP2C-type Ser/Thr phosphatase [Candidatus Poribacteria bacterium]
MSILNKRGKSMKILKDMFNRRTSKVKDIAYYGITDTGKQRDKNEDSYLLMPEAGIYVVADGMGGHNAGEIASVNTIKVIKDYFNNGIISSMRQNRNTVSENLKRAVLMAHNEIIDLSQQEIGHNGMGSTIALSFIYNNILHTCHVGDSRVYVINDTGITQITSDHSTVAELVQSGKMTSEEARLSPLKNQITQAVGTPLIIEPEYNHTYRLKKDDMILLCSDGLWDMLSDNQIYIIVNRGKTLEKICKDLVYMANDAGGDDNITIVLLKIKTN